MQPKPLAQRRSIEWYGGKFGEEIEFDGAERDF
jgi:hypothetical protein